MAILQVLLTDDDVFDLTLSITESRIDNFIKTIVDNTISTAITIKYYEWDLVENKLSINIIPEES